MSMPAPPARALPSYILGVLGVDPTGATSSAILAMTAQLEPLATILLPLGPAVGPGATTSGLADGDGLADGTALGAGRVYTLPRGTTGLVDGHTLHVRTAPEPPGDPLVLSLAESFGARATLVVLDGSAATPSALRHAREQGTLILALATPETAELAPHADEALPLDGLLARLAAVFGSEGPPLAELLDAVCQQVFAHTGNDFREYRHSTLLRRIQRRMTTLGVARADAYLKLVEAGPEAEALVRELLVSVTRFFRDADALAALSTQLAGGPSAGEELRAWVPGCATGEEAYTLAMLLLEHRGRSGARVVVFATDLDDAALAVARAGRYPATIADDVSPERLARYFERDRGDWVVGRELRDCCVFSHHNLVHDPPFSRLSLVSCRNVLIYLEAPLQARLLQAFHFSLAGGGLLLLGSAESADQRPDLFDAVAPSHRLYARRVARAQPGTGPVARQAQDRKPLPAPRPVPSSAPSAAPRAIERALLDRFVPPGAVVNERGEVVYVCGPPSSLLESPRGSAPFDVVGLVRPPLRHPLRVSLAEAHARSDTIESQPISVTWDGQTVDVAVVVRPLAEVTGPPLYLVALETRGEPRPQASATAAEPRVETLERELHLTREQWHATQQQLERSNDELRASNEEFQALNEELHTSREELQSINEELQSVNAELRQKIDQLDAANGDLQNLFDATSVGAVLLDATGRIRRFSPTATDLFPVLPTDVGRPLVELSARVPELPLQTWLASVRSTGEPVSAAVRRQPDGVRFALRVVPYRTLAGAADGVVVTFLDVSALDDAERKAEERAADLAQLLQALPVPVFFTRDPEARVVTGNALAARHLRTPPQAPLPIHDPQAPFRFLSNGVPLATSELAIARAARGETIRDFVVEVRFDDGVVRHLLGNAEPLRAADGSFRGAVAAFIDVTARLETEAALAASEERFRTLAGTARDFITRFDRELRFLYANPAVLARMNQSLEALVGSTAGLSVAWQGRLLEVFEHGRPLRFDWPGEDGEWFDVQLSPELRGRRSGPAGRTAGRTVATAGSPTAPESSATPTTGRSWPQHPATGPTTRAVSRHAS